MSRMAFTAPISYRASVRGAGVRTDGGRHVG